MSSLKKFFINTIKRPPGPSLLESINSTYEDTTNINLDYPVNLATIYGDLVYSKHINVHIGMGPSVFEHILRTNPKNYIREKTIYGHMKLIFGNSLLVNEGDAWKYRRKLALPSYQHQTIQNYIPIITDSCKKILEMWGSSLPKEINLLATLNEITLSMAFKMFCGLEPSPHILKIFGKGLSFCNHYLATATFIKPWKPTINNIRFYWYIHKMNQVLLDIIKKRRKEPKQTEDLLQLLINGYSEETQQPLNDSEVLAEFKTHLITGHETTACALTWMWYLLAKYPEYRSMMEAELDAILGGKTPTAADIPKLVLTKAIISETLRLYPPIWSFARTNIADDVINGYEIPANSKIALHIYALHRNPHYWKKPNEFYPERFLEPNANRHAFLFLPFSAGSHTCIASHLGMLEITLIAATLAQKIRFEKTSKTKAIREPNVTLKPKGGIIMKPVFIKE